MAYADLSQRTKTAALVIGALIILEIGSRKTALGQFFFLIVAFLLAAGCGLELKKIAYANLSPAKMRAQGYLIVLIAPLVLAIFSAVEISPVFYPSFFAALTILALVVSLIAVFMNCSENLDNGLSVAPELFIGALIVAGGGTALIYLAAMRDHSLLFSLIAIVAANDIGAYFVGKSFGAHKLLPSVSPGKTWEGALGGLFIGILTAWFLTTQGFFHLGSTLQIFVTTAAVIITAQLFDLGKSFIKRRYGVKDTGSILPGHGGLLDRLDGILGGAFAYYLSSFVFGILTHAGAFQ